MGDPPAPVNHRVTKDGAGLVDLPGQAAHRRVRGGPRAQPPGATEQEESGVVELFQLAVPALADDAAERGAGRLNVQGVHDRGEVNLGGHQARGAVVERGQGRPVGGPVGEVDVPRLAGHVRHQADVTRALFQDRPAPVLPRALAALGRTDRRHGQLNIVVRVVLVRDVDDGQPPRELAVVGLHDWLIVDERRVQVEPGHVLLGADDRSEAGAGGGHPDRLQHPLVVGELEEVVPTLAGRSGRVRCLPGQCVE